jgi:hypothetical protein
MGGHFVREMGEEYVGCMESMAIEDTSIQKQLQPFTGFESIVNEVS